MPVCSQATPVQLPFILFCWIFPPTSLCHMRYSFLLSSRIMLHWFHNYQTIWRPTRGPVTLLAENKKDGRTGINKFRNPPGTHVSQRNGLVALDLRSGNHNGFASPLDWRGLQPLDGQPRQQVTQKHCAPGLQPPGLQPRKMWSRLAAVPVSSSESICDGFWSAPMGADREDAGQWTADWNLSARLTWLLRVLSIAPPTYHSTTDDDQRASDLICWMGTPAAASQRAPETRGECPPNARRPCSSAAARPVRCASASIVSTTLFFFTVVLRTETMESRASSPNHAHCSGRMLYDRDDGPLHGTGTLTKPGRLCHKTGSSPCRVAHTAHRPLVCDFFGCYGNWAQWCQLVRTWTGFEQRRRTRHVVDTQMG